MIRVAPVACRVGVRGVTDLDSRARQEHGHGDLRGCLATSVARRRVGARDTTVEHVLGPFRPRPVPLLMAARGVGQPTGSDPGESDLAGRSVDGIRYLTRKSWVGERPRGRRSPLMTPAASLRGERPYREEAEEDHEGNGGTVAVERADSLASPGEGPARPRDARAFQRALEWIGRRTSSRARRGVTQYTAAPGPSSMATSLLPPSGAARNGGSRRGGSTPPPSGCRCARPRGTRSPSRRPTWR